MLFAGGPTKERDQRRLDADQVQATMQQVHDHLHVQMRSSQAIQDLGKNRGHISALNFLEQSQV